MVSNFFKYSFICGHLKLNQKRKKWALNHGAPQSQRSTVGPTDYDTPQYSSSSYSDTSHSFHYSIPDISMQPPTRWVYEWENPHFYTMLVQEWETTSAWTGQSWQDYRRFFCSTPRLPLKSKRFKDLTGRLTGGNRLNRHFGFGI